MLSVVLNSQSMLCLHKLGVSVTRILYGTVVYSYIRVIAVTLVIYILNGANV